MFYQFTGLLWKYSSVKASWYFITLPFEVSRQIKRENPVKRGYGSIRVVAKISQTQWKTSIFPDSKKKSYIIPIKVQVRNKLALQENQEVQISIEPETII